LVSFLSFFSLPLTVINLFYVQFLLSKLAFTVLRRLKLASPSWQWTVFDYMNVQPTHTNRSYSLLT
jgi:hypothetical protein